MRISLLLLSLVSILGCEVTDENDEPRETRGALMERIGTEKEKEKEKEKGKRNRRISLQFKSLNGVGIQALKGRRIDAPERSRYSNIFKNSSISN